MVGPTLIAIAREMGASGYVAGRSNRWAAVHTLDAARVYRLGLEGAPPGSRLHAVADEGLPFREIAEAIGGRLGLATASVAPEHFSFLAPFVALDSPVSSAITRRLLAWKPAHPGLIEDIDDGHYFA